MPIGRWVLLALVTVAGLLGLVFAGQGQDSLSGELGLVVFLLAIVYVFWLVKKTFDEQERRPRE